MTVEAEREQPWALIVAGPTASGKSALAMMLAEDIGGMVINADSMQVYRELRVLTARPTVEEEAVVPHALYGVRPAAEAGSVAWWREAALAAMQAARDAGRVPILCGGTGMYFLSLTQGLSEIPAPSEAAREEARAVLAEHGPAALHTRLAACDPGPPRGCAQPTASAWPAPGRSGAAPDGAFPIGSRLPGKRRRGGLPPFA